MQSDSDGDLTCEALEVAASATAIEQLSTRECAEDAPCPFGPSLDCIHRGNRAGDGFGRVNMCE